MWSNGTFSYAFFSTACVVRKGVIEEWELDSNAMCWNGDIIRKGLIEGFDFCLFFELKSSILFYLCILHQTCLDSRYWDMMIIVFQRVDT